MPRFLGLKTYLTTNRSNIVKQQKTKARRSRLTNWGILREDSADRLKCPLCFCVPCFVGAVVLLVLVSVYVTTPYMKSLNFETSKCTVLKIEFSTKGSCSLRTEQFKPCFKIIVNYMTTEHKEIKSVLMENEQTVTHCDKCSYTFGKGSLFEKHGGCSKPRTCVEIYNEKYGKINSRYPCYYDPENPQNVFKQYKISRSEVIYQTLLPALFILLYILGFIFVRYDDYKRRKINGQIKLENHRHTVGTRRHIPENTTSDSKSNSSLTSDSPSSSGSTAAMFRVRKKKMPCTKVHAFSSRDDEDVIMEEKPISPVNKRQSNVFMEVNVDKLAPRCACVSHQSVSNGFELTRVRETFRPVIPSQHHYRNQLKQSRRALRYLPESVV